MEKTQKSQHLEKLMESLVLMNNPIKSLHIQLFCEMDSKNQSNALLTLIHYCKPIPLPRNLAAVTLYFELCATRSDY